MVEGARLESVYTGDRIQGSNPCLSATPSPLEPQHLTRERLNPWLCTDLKTYPLAVTFRNFVKFEASFR